MRQSQVNGVSAAQSAHEGETHADARTTGVVEKSAETSRKGDVTAGAMTTSDATRGTGAPVGAMSQEEGLRDDE